MTERSQETTYYSMDLDPDTGELRRRAVSMRSVPLLIESSQHTQEGAPHPPAWSPGRVAVLVQVDLSREDVARELSRIARALSLDPPG